MRERLLWNLSRWVVAHPRWVLAIAAVVTVVAAVAMMNLEVRTARTALYPRDHDVSQRFEAYLQNFGAGSQVIVVLDGEPADLPAFADLVAEELLSDPAVIRQVFHRIDPEFFLTYGPLFESVETLDELLTRLEPARGTVQTLLNQRSLPDQLTAWNGPGTGNVAVPEDAASLNKALDIADEILDEVDRWLDDPKRTEFSLVPGPRETVLRNLPDEGYFRSYDGRMLFLFVQPTSKSEQRKDLEVLVNHCREAGQRAAKKWSGEAPIVALTGLPVNNLEETVTIEHDVVFTAGLAAAMILLVILLGLRSIRSGILVFIPLVLAAVWNLGLAQVMVGYLTLLTSAFTAILFGVGVDYGIFLTRRIGEELQAGAPRRDAVAAAIQKTGRTLLAASTTTALAFLMLSTLDFQGFTELGLIAGTGILLVTTATLTVLPALAVLVGASPVKLPGVAPAAVAGGHASSDQAPTGQVSRRGRWFAGSVTILGFAAFIVSLWLGSSLPTDFDLMSIMPRDSEAVKYQRAMAKGSDFQPEFLVATAATPDEARALAEQLRTLDTVARVDSVSDLIPGRQAEKMERLGKLSAILGGISLPAQADPVNAEGWSTAFEAVMAWLEDGQDKAFTVGHKDVVARLETLYGRFEKLVSRIQGDAAAVQRLNDLQNAWFKVAHDWSQRMDAWWKISAVEATSLPEGLMERFRGEDGALAVYMFPKDSIYDMDFLDRFLGQVYPLAPDAIGFPSTHQVFSRMVLEGFKRASALAVLAVLLLLFIEFRSVKWTLIAFLPLLFGGAWMFGILRLMGQSLNYTNVIALPLVIGMAVDYGVYLAHRLMEHRSDDPWSTIRRFGGPVVLAALTTLAGISALVMGIHQGVATLGEALVIGIVSCLLAAVLVLPCLLGFAGIKTGDKVVVPRGNNPKDAGVLT